MIKECSVLANNGENIVVEFSPGRKVQLPLKKYRKDTVFVKLENGEYSVSSKEAFLIEHEASFKKKYEQSFAKDESVVKQKDKPFAKGKNHEKKNKKY